MEFNLLFISIIGLIIFFLAIGLIGNWQYAYQIQQLQRALHQFKGRQVEWEEGSPRHEILEGIIMEYREQRLAGVEHLNTQALLERYFNGITIRILGIFPLSIGSWPRFINFLSAGTVMLGLLGTFIGLTLALFGMQEVLTSLSGAGGEEVSISTIVSSISQPFEGMSFAFLTSIFGIGSSLLLSALSSGLLGRLGPNSLALQGEFLTECEDFLDNRFYAFLETLKPRGSMDELMERLASKLKESFDQGIASFAKAIVTMITRLDESISGINGMVQKQEQIINAFEHGSTQLVTFGTVMENTVQVLVKNHKDTASQMDQLGLRIHHLNEAIRILGEKTADSSKSLENLVQSSTQNLQLLQNFHKQVEESGRQMGSFVQQVNQEMMQRIREQWDQLRRDWQSQKEQQMRKEQENQHQLLRQMEQVFQKMDQSYQEKHRSLNQNVQQSFEELSRLIHQQEELGQRTMESHRYLIERLPNLSRAAEEFSRSIENLDRLFHDFLERTRREIMTWMSQSQDRERKLPLESNRELREVVRELEEVRNVIEREFNQSHRLSHDTQQLVEAIYQTGRSAMRQTIEAKAVDHRTYAPSRSERESFENGRYRDEGFRR